MSKRVVVAGGTGFIGEPLVRRFVARGHDVAVLTRNPGKVRAGRGVGWDGRTQGPWSSGVADADVVINLAGENIGEGRWTAERKRRIAESRLDATGALVEALRGAPPRAGSRTFLSASAVGYYGSHGDEEISESTGPGSDYLAGVCRRWEEAAGAAGEQARLIIVRIGIVLAEDGGALAKMLLPFRLFAGGKFGSGRQWMSWIARQDLLRLIEWAIDNDAARGLYNATSPNPVRNVEFTRTLARVLRRPSLASVPALALRLALGEMGESLLLTGQRVLPARALEGGFDFRFETLERALRELLVTE
jgi:hypothetical protein